MTRGIPMPRLARDAVHTAMRGYTGVCVGHGARMNCSWERRRIELNRIDTEFPENHQKTINLCIKMLKEMIFQVFRTSNVPTSQIWAKADSQHHCEDLRWLRNRRQWFRSCCDHPASKNVRGIHRFISFYFYRIIPSYNVIIHRKIRENRIIDRIK